MLNVSADIGHVSLLKRSLPCLNWDAYLKSSVAGYGANADLSADVFDDAVDDVETEARAFADALGCEKRIEDARQRFRWDAGAVVGNFDEDKIVFAGGVDSELAAVFQASAALSMRLVQTWFSSLPLAMTLGRLGA